MVQSDPTSLMSLWVYPNQPLPAGLQTMDMVREHHRTPRKSWMIWIWGERLAYLTCCHRVTRTRISSENRMNGLDVLLSRFTATAVNLN